mgnify:CR=1 FL=1
MLRGFVEELSISKIAKNCDLSTKTVWLAKTKVNQAIMTMYGYTDLFRGNTQADEYYTRTAFGKDKDWIGVDCVIGSSDFNRSYRTCFWASVRLFIPLR